MALVKIKDGLCTRQNNKLQLLDMFLFRHVIECFFLHLLEVSGCLEISSADGLYKLHLFHTNSVPELHIHQLNLNLYSFA